MTEIKELVKKANAQCKRIKDYITENEEMFDSMDLKLHDASFYQYKDMENDFPLCYADSERNTENSYFYQFCESSYEQFIEWCEEQGIDFSKICHHINRTSQFYLYDKDLIQRDRGKIEFGWTMDTIFNEFVCTNYYQMIEFNDDGFIDEEKSFEYNKEYFTREEWIEELKPILEYIISDMYNDFMGEIEDVKNVYEYIQDTKENQVEYFKDFLEWHEENLRYEKDKADKEEEKRVEIIDKMPQKVRKIMKYSALDSEELNVVLECMA